MLNNKHGNAIVLAIHGSASSGRQWKTLAKLLEGKWRVLTPDMPGYGTTRDQDRRVFFDRLVAAEQYPIDIIAHSFGCSVAMYLANAMPEQVRSVTLYDPVVAVGGDGANMAPDLAAVWQKLSCLDDVEAMQLFIDYWTGRKTWQGLDRHHQARLIEQLQSVKRDFREAAGGFWSVREIRYRGPLAIRQGALSPAAIEQTSCYLKGAYSDVRVATVPALGHMAPLTQSHITDQLFKDCLETMHRRPLLAA